MKNKISKQFELLWNYIFVKYTGSILQISSIQSTLNNVKEKLHPPQKQIIHCAYYMLPIHCYIMYVHAYEFACYFEVGH